MKRNPENKKIFKNLKNVIKDLIKGMYEEHKYNIVVIENETMRKLWKKSRLAERDNLKLAEDFLDELALVEPEATPRTLGSSNAKDPREQFRGILL